MSMFEKFLLFPPSCVEIPLVTRAIKQIKNCVAPNPGPENIAIWKKLLKKHRDWEPRKPPVGGYNCAGHIWGSRRTAIYDEEGEVAQIRSEDELSEVKESDLAPGDIVVYYLNHSSRPYFLHVAEVIEVPENGRIGIKVLSKFSDWGGEVFHSHVNVPPSWGTPQKDFFYLFLREQ